VRAFHRCYDGLGLAEARLVQEDAMYRMVIPVTVWFGSKDFDDARAQETAERVAEAVASACDEIIGRPLTEEHDVPYLLLWEPNVADGEGEFEKWLVEHVLREGVRGVMMPRAWSEAPLQ
jgi:hypothetical protein